MSDAGFPCLGSLARGQPARHETAYWEREARMRFGWKRFAATACAGMIAMVAPSAAVEPAPPVDLAPADRLGSPAESPRAGGPGADDCCEGEGPNRGSVWLSFNNDFTTAYFFRGILQERNGFIWQPSLDIGITVFEGEGVVQSVDLAVGTWNSVHSNKTLASGSGPSNWYESDVYPSLSVGFAGGLATALTYQVYTGPNGSFATVQNLDLDAAWDDSDFWGAPFGLAPWATLSFELDRTNFGEKKGVYLGLGLEPNVTLFAATELPLTIAMPLALGLSLDDYYETPEEGDDTFGFFSFGLGLSVPLAFVPEGLGSWSTSAGIDVYVLGDNLKEANFGDSPFPVGTLGVLMEY